MFNLVLSPYGSIRRMRFFVGHIEIIVLALLMSFAYMYIFPHIVSSFGIAPTDFAATFDAILKSLSSDLIPLPKWNKTSGLIYISGSIFILIILWSNICLIVKRIRDLDVSLWFALIPTGALTYICLIVMLTTHTLTDQTMLNLTEISGVLQIISFLILLFYPSRLNNSSPLDDDEDDDDED